MAIEDPIGFTADHEMTISEEVSSGSEECVSYTPPSGNDVHIYLFAGEAAYTKNAAVKLVWDYGGGGETVIWTIKGSGSMPFTHVIPSADIDGVKKLAICLDNGESGALFMSGHAEIWVDD